MILFVGPNGGINWDNTQTMLRHNWEFFLKLRNETSIYPQEKFGSPHLWSTFYCEGRCERTLPIDIADVDHMQPRASFNWSIIPSNPMNGNKCISAIKGHWSLMQEGAILCINIVTGVRDWSSYQISRDKQQIKIIFNREIFRTESKIYEIKSILENDVTNLQLLCPPCNRSKGANMSNSFIRSSL